MLNKYLNNILKLFKNFKFKIKSNFFNFDIFFEYCKNKFLIGFEVII